MALTRTRDVSNEPLPRSDNLIKPVSEAFFDNGKFFKRTWTLWFIHNEAEEKEKLFVPQSEFQLLLNDIHKEFQEVDNDNLEQYWTSMLLVEIPSETHVWFAPLLLGFSQSESEFRKLFADIFRLIPVYEHQKTVSPPTEEQKAEFQHFWKQLDSAEKPKAQNPKAEKRKAEKSQKQLAALKESDEQLKRAQQYLGLRSATTAVLVDTFGIYDEDENDNLVATPAQRFVSLHQVNPNSKIPFPCFRDAILIAVDLEAFWRAQHLITEVGVAVLDTRDIANVAPQESPLGKNWHTNIYGYHIQPYENIHLSNKEIDKGNRDGFIFGSSEVCSMSLVRELLQKMFSVLDSKNDTRSRNIVLVGHDIQQDIKYLTNIPFNPYETGVVIDTIDTQRLYHSTMGGALKSRHANLERILRKMDIAYINLHNAGNDAVYTLKAFLAMALLEATRRPKAPSAEGNPT